MADVLKSPKPDGFRAIWTASYRIAGDDELWEIEVVADGVSEALRLVLDEITLNWPGGVRELTIKYQGSVYDLVGVMPEDAVDPNQDPEDAAKFVEAIKAARRACYQIPREA